MCCRRVCAAPSLPPFPREMRRVKTYLRAPAPKLASLFPRIQSSRERERGTWMDFCEHTNLSLWLDIYRPSWCLADSAIIFRQIYTTSGVPGCVKVCSLHWHKVDIWRFNLRSLRGGAQVLRDAITIFALANGKLMGLEHQRGKSCTSRKFIYLQV